MAHRNNMISLCAALALVACGGDEPVPANVSTANAPAASQQDTTEESTELVREAFVFRSTGRDPFLSLVRQGGDVRPFLDDLRLVSLILDAGSSAQNVAILRDTNENKRYAVRVGDQLGRMRVTEIRERTVVFTIEDFGVPRQVTLSMRAPQGRDR